jgi:phage-related protein
MDIKILPQVTKFIAKLDPKLQGDAFRLIDRLRRFGNHLEMPDSRALGSGLFELRGTGRSIIRIFYTYHNNDAVLLHIYLKKSQKIPTQELRLARKRMTFDTV